MRNPPHISPLRALAAAAVGAALIGALLAAPEASAAPPATGNATPGKVEVEIPGKETAARDRRGQGHTTAGSGYTWVSARGRHGAPHAELSPAEARDDGDVTKVVDNGSTADRLDVVILGDGYTSTELGQFHTDARSVWNEIAAVQPYASYQSLFNVWTVDAVSNESGVSGDPSQNVVRDTALGSYFWCDNTERLLCVDESKVDAYVARSPEADLVIVLANSSKYGGAGYNTPSPSLGYEGIATASAGNAQSAQVAIHETGHSLGKLADEYFYADVPGYEHYSGPEPGESNSSVLTAGQMAGSRTKWYRWLGQASPDGGTVGAYEGGGYYVTGLNRPTANSMMRSLGKPFNLPGVEAMIAGFYRHAAPATALTPTKRILHAQDTARIALAQPVGPDTAPLKVDWYLDGKRLPTDGRTTTVAVGDLPLTSRSASHTLAVRVIDPTTSVRDPALAKTLRTTLMWKVSG